MIVGMALANTAQWDNALCPAGQGSLGEFLDKPKTAAGSAYLSNRPFCGLGGAYKSPASYFTVFQIEERIYQAIDQVYVFFFALGHLVLSD